MSLSLVNLYKVFDEKVIFKDFSYDFSECGVYAVLGQSGIGKTTLLRMIAGLDKNYQGKIIGAGVKNVSMAFQEYRLFPTLTALENVAYASAQKITPEIKTSAQNMLISLGFSIEDMQLMPNELSGGMKQRVSLARAFMKNAKIFLLDEPTKEIDGKLSDTVRDMIIEKGKSALVIFVTHNLEDVAKTNATVIKL